MAVLGALVPEALAPLTRCTDDEAVATMTPPGLRPLSLDRRPTREKASRALEVPGLGREIQVKMASEAAEWDQAFRLVAATYQARGWNPPDAGPVRFTPYHTLPDTVTFVAKHGSDVVATLSLVQDNALLGLPMQSIYASEIESLRRDGRRLVEVTSLADSGLSLREFVPVFLTLMRLLSQYTISQGADTWVISINPRHRSFYRKVMGFVPLGPWRAYPQVQNHPAEAYLLDMPLLKANVPEMYQQIFGEWLSRETLTAPRMPAELVRYFSGVSGQMNNQMADEVLAYVEQCGSPRRW
jgi:hypothetical protein